MEKFQILTTKVAPLKRANIDTDAIMPKQFLKSIKRTGYGQYIFDEWRYLDVGEPGMDCSKRPLNTSFSLNQPQYQGAEVLLTLANFGCGSSREHAPWGLHEYGFKVIIAPSFADIFYNNCTKNGILPIVLPETVVLDLFEWVETTAINQITIDLAAQQVTPFGKPPIAFTIDAAIKHKLLEGLDDIGITLQYKEEIKAFEKTLLAKYPWNFIKQ